MINRKIAVRGAVAITLSIFVALSPGDTAAQIFGGGNAADMQIEIERLQRDMRDLQMEIFRDGNTGGGQTGAAISTQRVDDIEQSLRRLTGDMEGLMFQLDQFSQRMDRTQSQIDFIERNQSVPDLLGLPRDGAIGVGPGQGAPGVVGEKQTFEMPLGSPRDLALAPSNGTLGTIPENPALPAQQGPLQEDAALQGNALPGNLPPLTGGGDPEGEFQAAMALLTRAQYGRAEEAFRTFSLIYPDTELGAQALYWTADIAYSVDRDYQGAAQDFAELLRQYPDAPRAPEGMLKLGLSLLALGQIQEGCVTLAALPRTFPNAPASINDRARAERQNAACA
jgi:tol-pal system protein YbgF